MREDERFVIQAVAAHCSGKWRPGENPPDAYIDMDQGTIAVEISTLSQQVTSDQGRHVRLSDDATAIRLADQLNDDMQALIPDGITVCLRLSSPIASFKKTKAQLVTIIEKMMRDGALDGTESERIIYGNKVLIWVSMNDDSRHKKVSAVISNRHSSPDILQNAANTLEDRINAKWRKCREIMARPLWLVLLNDYWLADAQTYRLAMSNISTVHSFDKILIVEGDGSISPLYD
jgi:hypothetical protein